MDSRSSGGSKLGGRGRVGLVLGLLLATGLVVRLEEQGRDVEPAMPPHPVTLPDPSANEAEQEPEHAAAPESRRLALPQTSPPHISCAEAQRATLFLARELAAPAIAPTPAELAGLWGTLLDPHGMWSAAPDSPLGPVLAHNAAGMLRSLHERVTPCDAADEVARAFQSWLSELGALYDSELYAARLPAPPPGARQLFELVAEPLFEDDPVTRPGRELARQLGRRLGAFAARFPNETSVIEQARARFFPSDLRTLSEIVTLAALRAYVPLVDPHGDFAPLDEEWALYAGDSTLDAGSPLWGDVARVPLGARITSDPAPPLELDDIVLDIGGFTLAGASIDQIEQASRSGDIEPLSLRVLRQGEIVELTIDTGEAPEATGEPLELERIAYGRDGVVLRIAIPDVSDELGRDLEQVLAQQAPEHGAILLDLRGNGGGSLDAAVESLGLLLPGAPLFSLIHRAQVTEVLSAPRAPQPYLGPVAALVDGDTASAAEMLAGALQAYRRGPVIGARTFGKGCVQEYFDDVVASGVLRMTTLQFVLPSGKPLQQIGLTPDLSLPLAPASERESHITRQPITFDGPDVRSREVPAGPAWPRESASAGPCSDTVVCQAISRLARGAAGDAAAGARATRNRAGTR